MNDVNDGNSDQPNSEVDPLIWHYEREKRVKMRGSIVWRHEIESKDNDKTKTFLVNVNFAFVANASYLDVLVPTSLSPGMLGEVFGFVRNNAAQLAANGPIGSKIPVIRELAAMKFDRFPDQNMTSDDCVFTGRVYVYTLYNIADSDKQALIDEYRKSGLYLIIRDGRWIDEIQRFIDRPTVFLGHDSADKDDLVRELAHMINGKEIRVWYDEISLKPGDRLRKSLDDGLEEADYFLPVITDSWLKNERYAEYEFDAIMQRYVTEKSVIIVPICVGISPSRLKEKSRVLADMVAIVHGPNDSLEHLARKIADSVDPRIPNIGEPLPEIELPKTEGLFSVGITVGPRSENQATETSE